MTQLIALLNRLLRRLLGRIWPVMPLFRPTPARADTTPVTVRVLLLIHNPLVPQEGNRKLHEVGLWNDPDELAAGLIDDVRRVSHGYVQYEIAERVEVDSFPVKKDGFTYTTESFLSVWRNKGPFHEPDAVDYLQLVEEFNIITKINVGLIDEVWLLGMPYAGYYESIMAGPDAFWCNAPPLAGIEHAARRFIIMGFNYERGVGEMLEAVGHRVESIMTRVYRHKSGPSDLWEKFTRYDKIAPGQAECGNVHFAPNSERDYDWGNPRPVTSYCDDWFNFPDFQGVAHQVDCSEWGNGDTRLHHRWWLEHLPHVSGMTDGVSNNWWEYVIDPNKVL